MNVAKNTESITCNVEINKNLITTIYILEIFVIEMRFETTFQ
jgi:hypothetical protein